jgi:hypothetical protein
VNTLQPPTGSPWWLEAGAAAILFLHIAGGSIALVAGAAAMALRKGSPRHALAGTIFFGSMLVMAGIGAIVAPFLESPRGDPRWFDSLAGTFTLYMVATGWMTVRRRAGTTGRFEVVAFLFAALAAAFAASLAVTASRNPGATLGGYGPEGYGFVAALFALAAALDIKAILAGGVSGIPRIARHLWRMCVGLFIAAGSFFLGQQEVMPEFVRGSPLLVVPPFAVLALMIFWLLRLRFARLVGRFTAARGRKTAA